MKKKRETVGDGELDPRFAAARTDPRFQRFPKSQRKVEIDERFADMFKDKAFQVRSAVDKRGRKIAKAKQKGDMQKYYRLQGQEDGKANVTAVEEDDTKGKKVLDDIEQKPSKRQKLPKVAKSRNVPQGPHRIKADSQRPKPAKAEFGLPSSSEDAKSEDLDFENEEEARAAERWARVRGLTGPDSSSPSSSDEGSDSEELSSEGDIKSDSEDIDLAEWGVGAMAGNPDEEVPEVQEETSRLAILDLDWSKVKATDILAMLQSFLRKGQQVKKVTVYPSDYGLQRMAEEARFGPQGLATSKASANSGNANAAMAIPRNGNEGASNGGTTKRGKGFSLSKEERAAILETLNEQDSGGEESGGTSEEEEGKEEEEGEGSSDASGASDLAEDLSLRDGQESSDTEPDDDVTRRRLQLYERSRLRYYYAIAECTDVATARHLYTECDGMEFEHSASLFDLRYVPDSEDFSRRQVREEATAVPSGYKPPEVGIAAMLHTKPKLTWDGEDEGRKRMLHKRISKEELRDDDFKAYLGSESDEDDQPGEERQSASDRYRQLLTGAANNARQPSPDSAKEGSVSEEEEDTREDRDQGMEMEVTFGGGLDGLSQRLKAKTEDRVNKKNDTVWQAYLRRRQEQRRKAKARGRKADDEDDDLLSSDDAAEQDPYFKHADNAFDDPFFNDGANGTADQGAPNPTGEGTKTAKRQKKKQEKDAANLAEKQRQAQLELLLMDDKALQDAVKLGARVGEAADNKAEPGAPRQKLSKKAHIAAKKAAKRAKRGAASDEEDLPPTDAGSRFSLDVNDRRFDALFTSPDFALDPTDPRYRASEGTKNIQKEAALRRGNAQASHKGPIADIDPPSKKQSAQADGSNGDMSNAMKQLTASLKKKGAAKARRSNA